MIRRLSWCLFATTLAACGSSQSPDKPTTPEAPVGPPPAPVAVAPVPPPVAVAPAPAPGPTAKELETEKAWAKIQSDNQAELARWTPELRATAKRLSETSYPSTGAALRTLLASAHRKPGDAERDKYRHPRESLEFFGLQPTSTVLEFGPGGGWYTELLAPMLAKKGKLFVTTDQSNGVPSENSTQNAERLKLLLQSAPELYSKVETVTIDGKNPKLALDGTLDTVLVIRMLHGFVNNGTLDGWLAEFKHALKPKGVLAVIEHRAPVGSDAAVSSKKGYVPEAWAIEHIEAAGFKLAGKSEINANPKDTKDYPEGVWSLPPTYREGDKNREKYAAIGESDRFTLRFVKK